MRNIHFDGYLGPRLPRDVQLKRVQQVIRKELSELQRYTLEAYYHRELSVTQIALERGVNKSTVSRTLRRAENNLRKYLKY